MNRILVDIALVCSVALAACSRQPTPAPSSRPAAAATRTAPRRPAVASSPGAAMAATSAAPRNAEALLPPPDARIPDTPFGATVRDGQRIFIHTHRYAGRYTNNDLSCRSCHLDAGRRAGSAPMWAAWVRYPRYRFKSHSVVTFTERLQDCFRFSMNGTPPPADSRVIKALTAYSYWLATGAPTGVNLPGYGYPALPPPPAPPSYRRGDDIYRKVCAACHGPEGQGQRVAGATVIPPLWGPHSFNWGAGMASVKTAAKFIHANMPWMGEPLTPQEAWDTAWFLDAHERPQDPRFTGSVAATRRRFHHSRWSLYGRTMNGHLLGVDVPAGR